MWREPYISDFCVFFLSFSSKVLNMNHRVYDHIVRWDMLSLTDIWFSTRSKCLINDIKKMSGTQHKKFVQNYGKIKNMLIHNIDVLWMVSSPRRNLHLQLHFTILDLIVMFIILIFIDWRQEAAITIFGLLTGTSKSYKFN